METIRWVCGVLESPSQFKRAADALLRLRFERQDILALDARAGDGALDSQDVQATIQALDAIGPVTEGSPMDPLLMETLKGFSISVRCWDEIMAKRAEAVLKGVGATEVLTSKVG